MASDEGEISRLLSGNKEDYGSGPSAVVSVDDTSYDVDARDSTLRTLTLNDDSRGLSPNDQQRDIILAWQNVDTYKIHPLQRGWWKFWRKNRQRPPPDHILKAVSGYLQSGTLLGVIGASGTGKTTLLNYLTSRLPRSMEASGRVTVNGVELGAAIRQISGYVQQECLFFGKITVREHLIFRALLRMDNRLTQKERIKRVDDIINELGLSKCQDSQIDVPESQKGISGGEKRRLAFATELLTDPNILFCDEPTSGLDAYMADNVVSTLRRMATEKRRAVLCTIHQASSQIFSLFHKFLLLADGRVTFFGSQDEAKEFFGSNGYVCPSNFNPADYYIMQVAKIPFREWESEEKIEETAEVFQDSEYGQELNNMIQSSTTPETANPQEVINQLHGNTTYTPPWCREFRLLLWRNVLTYFRHPLVIRLRIFQPLFLALLIGLLFHHHDMDQDAIIDINGALFFLVSVISYANVNAVVSGLPLSLPLLLREYGIGVYRTDTYFITKTLAELPLHFLVTAALVAVCYFTITLYRGARAFLICTGVLILVANISISFGMMVAYIAGNVGSGLALSTPLLVILMVFGGFFISSGSQPLYMKPFRYLSWFKYSFELMAVSQWQDVRHIKCYERRPHTVLGTNSTEFPCFRSGKDVLFFLNFDKVNVATSLIVLFSLLVGFRVIAYIALLIRARRSRL